MDINTLMPFLGGLASGFILTAIIAAISRGRGTDSGEKRPDAVQLLSILQEKGRFVDFLMDPGMKDADDAQIGAFAKTMHDGCKKVIDEYFPLRSAIDAADDSEYRIEEGFDPSTIKLVGNVGAKPPFKGVVRHSGWSVTDVKLPVRPDIINANIIAAAEIEVV